MAKPKSMSVLSDKETPSMLPLLPVDCAGDDLVWGEHIWSTDEGLSISSLLSFSGSVISTPKIDCSLYFVPETFSDEVVVVGGSDAWLAGIVEEESPKVKMVNLSGPQYGEMRRLAIGEMIRVEAEEKMVVVRQL